MRMNYGLATVKFMSVLIRLNIIIPNKTLRLNVNTLDGFLDRMVKTETIPAYE